MITIARRPFLWGAIATLIDQSLTAHWACADDLQQEHSHSTSQRAAENVARLAFESPKATSSAIDKGLVINNGVEVVVFTGPRFGDVELFRLASHTTLRSLILDSTSVTDRGIDAMRDLNAAIDISVSDAWAIGLLRRCCGRRSDKGVGWNYNPADIIDAVNYLRMISRSSALDVMRHFTATSTAEEQKCLTVVLPLAFRDRGEKVTSLRNSVEAHEVLSAHYDFMFLDIYMEEDIPFDIELVHPSVLGGSFPGTVELPPRRRYLVDWAATRAAPTTELLRPSKQPTRAAQRLFRELAATGRYNVGELAAMDKYLLSQAGAMEARSPQVGD